MSVLRLGYNADNQGEFISLPLEQLTHAHFKGMTGQGKSSLIAHAVCAMIHAGVGVTLLDPAGDLADQVLSLLIATGYFDDHKDAIERVIYLPLERGHTEGRYIPFNILNGYYDAHAASSVALEGFRRFFTDLEEGRTININSVIHLGSYALAERGLPLLPYWIELFSNPDFYKSIVPHLKDHNIRRQFEVMKLNPFFYKDKNTGELKIATPELADNAIKRMNRLVISPHVRYALSQKDNILDPAELMRSGRSVLLNLGISDPHAKTLIGALFTQSFEQTSRTFKPIGRPNPYVLAIDELRDFAFENGKSLETMFAQSRKAGVAVWIIHQYDAQLSDELNAALSQCATKVTFQTGYDDALVSVRNMRFPYDPYRIKERTGNPLQMGSYRTVYMSESDQSAINARKIMELEIQEAFIQRPGYGLSRMVTFPITHNRDEYRIEQLTRAYLDRYFRHKNDIEGDVDSLFTQCTPSPKSPADDTLKADKPMPKPRPSPKKSVQPPTPQNKQDEELLEDLLEENPETPRFIYPEDTDEF